MAGFTPLAAGMKFRGALGVRYSCGDRDTENRARIVFETVIRPSAAIDPDF